MRPLVRQLIAGARRRIESPQCWTQHAMARDRRGNRIGIFASADIYINAQSWCATGALRAEYSMLFRTPPDGLDVPTLVDAHHTAERILANAAAQALGYGPMDDAQALEHFNDHSQHGEVLALFDGVLDRARERTDA